MEKLWQDMRYALRMLGKNPGFAATSILTLALGIGAATAIFSVVYGVLLRPLPYRNAQQIVRLWEQSERGGHMNFADPNFEDVRSQNRSLQSLAEFSVSMDTVASGNEPARMMVAWVSKDFFDVMEVRPAVGRGFASDEQQFQAPGVALISDAYWKQNLGATRDLSAMRVKIGGAPYAIVGVMPAGFRFPENADVWIPREIFERYPSRTAHNFNVIGRLKDGSSVNAARTELTTIAQNLKQQYGQDTMMVAVAIEPVREAMTSNVRTALLILLGGSGFLLVIACANVMNLLLAQAAGRERELSVRSALGASGAQLTRQFLTESLVLSLTGGAAGIVLAYWGLKGLLALAPDNLPRLEEVSINIPVLLFSLAVAILAAVALGVLTALRTASADARGVLSETGRGLSGTVRKQRLNRAIVAGQLATAVVLLVGAVLLGRSLVRVLGTSSGFRIDGVLTMELRLPEKAKKSDRVEFLNSLLAQLRQVPGVEEAGGSSILPLGDGFHPDGSYVLMNQNQISPHLQELMDHLASGSVETNPAQLEELLKFFDQVFQDREHMGEANYAVVSEGYFKGLNIPVLDGRLFDDRDTLDAPQVAVISQSLAREKWPNQQVIGRTIEFGNMDGDPRLLTVVGVVGDVRDQSIEAPPRPTIYVNYRQRPQGTGAFTIFFRVPQNADGVFTAARSILRGLDPSIPPRFSTLANIYSASLGARRFSLILGGIFAITALLLALAGIYGVTSFSVVQRTREIGVRMALGATKTEVLGMVLRQAAVTGCVGAAAGILLSLAVTRWIESQLFEVSATDPLTIAGVALLLILFSLLACWIPGRRAAQVDPMVALRYE
jgi:ABC-type antimicrobial peptide transport system permease subunit